MCNHVFSCYLSVSGRLFYLSISCTQTGLAGHSRAPQPPEGNEKEETKETAPMKVLHQRKGEQSGGEAENTNQGAGSPFLLNGTKDVRVRVAPL